VIAESGLFALKIQYFDPFLHLRLSHGQQEIIINSACHFQQEIIINSACNGRWKGFGDYLQEFSEYPEVSSFGIQCNLKFCISFFMRMT